MRWQQCYLFSAFCVFLKVNLAMLSHGFQAVAGLREGGWSSQCLSKGQKLISIIKNTVSIQGVTCYLPSFVPFYSLPCSLYTLTWEGSACSKYFFCLYLALSLTFKSI